MLLATISSPAHILVHSVLPIRYSGDEIYLRERGRLRSKLPLTPFTALVPLGSRSAGLFSGGG